MRRLPNLGDCKTSAMVTDASTVMGDTSGYLTVKKADGTWQKMPVSEYWRLCNRKWSWLTGIRPKGLYKLVLVMVGFTALYALIADVPLVAVFWVALIGLIPVSCYHLGWNARGDTDAIAKIPVLPPDPTRPPTI